MLGSARELARTLLAFAETRARLAAGELEEQALRFVEIGLWVTCAMFFFGLAIVFVSLLVVLAFWDANRILAATLLTLFYVVAGIAGALVARARWRERPRFLAATLAELHKDRERADPAP